jgi:hypothetical protein
MGQDSVEVEWVAPGGRARRAGVDECWGIEFEAASPMRRFPSYRGQRHFPGLWWSSTTESHVGYESWLERDHVMLLDADPEVVGIASQPFRLVFDIEGRTVSHIPDFFVRFDGGGACVVDVRPAHRVGAVDKVKFDATREFCGLVPDWSFRLVHEPDPVLVGNVRWLSGFRHPRHRGGPWTSELTAAFAEPRALIAGVEAVGDPIAVLPVLYHLMWSGELVADLDDTSLDDATVVRVRAAEGGVR